MFGLPDARWGRRPGAVVELTPDAPLISTRTLREALAPYPGSLLDTLHDAGHNKKQTMALLLYQMRLQKLYDLLPVREEQL